MASLVPVAYHPAGRDTELRAVREELLAGRWMGVREVLWETRRAAVGGGRSWAVWTRRTQVLGAAAAGSNVVETWLSDEPFSVEARVLAARVATERALSAYRRHREERGPRWLEEVARLAAAARQACRSASEALPTDPVPWVCAVGLALVDAQGIHAAHRQRSPDFMLGPGPWGLLGAALERDPGNREAWHRMLHVVCARGTVPAAFAQYVSGIARPGSPLLVLPLYAHMEQYKILKAQGASTWLHWATDLAVRQVDRAVEDYFRRSVPVDRSEQDLNFLAHAMHAIGHGDAAEVFEAIGPYATPSPWQHVALEATTWQAEFERSRMFSAARGRRR